MNKNKKAQVQSIIIFFAIVIGVFFMGFMMIKLIGVILTPLSSQLGNMSLPAGSAINTIQTKTTGMWDMVIIALFAINVLILFVSAFMVDIHPIFIIFYIVAVVCLFIFGMPILQALDSFKTGLDTVGTPINLPATQFLIDNFGLVLIGIVILSGVLMYAKIKFFGTSQNIGGNY